MIEIPIRVNLSSTSESQQQFNLVAAETQHQFDLPHNEVIVGEKDYNRLINKPSIDETVLQGNVTLQQLGLQHIYYNTKDHWNSQQTLIAEDGAIYIYKDYYSHDENGELVCSPAFKIGDGTSFLIDMPIAMGDIADTLLEHIQNAVIHVTSDDKTFWNNKSSAYIDPQSNEETLVLSNTNFMLGGIIYNHG